MNLPLNIDWQQILLHLFNFVILAGGLYFLLYNPVKKFMDQRLEHYRALDEEAASKLAQAEKLKNDYENYMEYARSELDEKRAEVMRGAQETSDQTLQQARMKAEKILADARQDAWREKERIMQEAQSEIADLAVSAAGKLLLNHSEEDVFDQFLDAAENGEETAK